MRILVANKFWYRRAGLERVMFDEIAWLEAAGHEVAHFSATHPENDASPWSDYFVPYLEIGIESGISLRDKATAAGRMFWSFEAGRRFAHLLRDFRPDIVHVHVPRASRPRPTTGNAPGSATCAPGNKTTAKTTGAIPADGRRKTEEVQQDGKTTAATSRSSRRRPRRHSPTTTSRDEDWLTCS